MAISCSRWPIAPTCSSAAASCIRGRPRHCARTSICADAYSGCEDMENTVAVIGAGLIGRAWAMVFARAKWRVRVYDRDAAQLRAAEGFVAASLDEQAEYGLVGDPDAARAGMGLVAALDEALAGGAWA